MQKNTGLKRLLLAGVYAARGLRAAARHEAAFRQEALVALVLLPLAFWLDVGALERVALVGSVVLVLMLELVNSAIEAAIDRIGPEFHELSGRAKDLGSGAVLIGLVLAAYVWAELVIVPWLKSGS